MVLTVVLSVSAGLAFRKSFRGATFLFYVAIASLIMPSIITSLGIALEFRLLDDFIIKSGTEGWTTAMGLFTSGLGAHLTWTLPFGLLIMFAIFNRFDGRLEEAARDLGATPWQTFRHVVLPIILPSVVGIGLFGFTLSWDELARSSQAIGSVNTLAARVAGADDDRDETGYLCAWNVDQRRILPRHPLGADRHSCAPGATTAARVGRWQGNGVEPVSWANLTGIRRHMAGRE